MIVSIENAGKGGKGWSEYALGKNNEREKALLVLGDTELGDAICESLAYKSGNYVRFVLSFSDEDNVTPDKGREIVKEWFKEFMHGFKKEEYHLDIVEHTDTEHLHYHARIPKLNLLTQTQLKPYYHKADLGFKIAVNEYIAHKHGITVDSEKQRAIKPPQEKIKQIQNWREQQGQTPLSLKTKTDRAITQEAVNDFISELVQGGLLERVEDVIEEVEGLGFAVTNKGYDKGKGFHYLTIENESGKLRLKGDIYGQAFYEHDREDRAEAIETNRSIRQGAGESGRSGESLERALSAEREKRLTFIERQYGSARKRAYQAQHERSLKFDRVDDRKDHTKDTETSRNLGGENRGRTHGDDKRGEATPALYAKRQQEAHKDTSQAVDYSYGDGSGNRDSLDSRNMGRNTVPKPQNLGPTGIRGDASPNHEDTKHVYQEGMEQRSRGAEQTHRTVQQRRGTLDSLLQRSKGVNYDSTRTTTHTKPSTDAGDTQARARRLREQLEADSRRLRAELQAAHEERARQRAERRRELDTLLQTHHRAEQSDYYALKDAIRSSIDKQSVTTHLERVFSAFRKQFAYVKSRIDRGNQAFTKTLLEVVKKILNNPSEAPTKNRFDEKKREAVLEQLSKKEPEKEKEKVERTKENYRGPSMGM